ncbi:GumC family protein [Stakelama tenebrarum]|uniref:non-specific protein-tyrosine kinase n=1 Tax=Stakelama tenebrarum TaxID=2711215 RepID=A0A6G6Y3S8_9SPHN|nr:polysaccharide biosynthesis tyrosine autokinase [Sphingosinithalassobacter tenebrarum]QIG79549.1 polysaccharide biosynthesis tyrosine autokinase [Sphingosinithalassobacter tenebrarum]
MSGAAQEQDAWDDSGASLRRFYNILVRRRILIVACTIGALLIALVITLLSEPVYVARTTFEVQRDAPRIGVDATETDTSGSDEQFLQTQFALLKSRFLAAGVVKRLNLDSNADFMGEVAPVAGDDAKAIAAQRQRRVEAATSMVQQGIEVEPYSSSSVIQLSFSSQDPRLAATIANAAVAEFTESSVQRRFAASSYTRTFVGQRLSELKERLEESERELIEYANENGILSVTNIGGEGGGQSLDSAAMISMNEKLATARAAKILAEERWRMAQSAGGQAMAEISEDPQFIALSQRLEALQSEYQQKRSTFRPEYPPMRQLASQIASVEEQLAGLRRQKVAELRATYQLAVRDEQALTEEFNQMKTSMFDLQNRGVRYAILQREVDTNRALYEALLQRYKEIGVAGGAGANSVSVVDRARVPGSPSSPILWLNLFLAAVAGVAIGVGAAFVIELADDTVKTPEDVQEKLHLPLLGVTPAVEGNVDEALGERRSGIAEAYQSIQTAMQLATPGGLPRSLLLTSTDMGEGKSTTAAALVRGMAERGKRVLLVDADLRRPTLHRRFSKPNTLGLANVLADGAPASEAIISLEDEGFDILCSGPIPPNPAQLLSVRLAEFLDTVLPHYDIVVLDGPPVLGLSDAPLMADVAQATALVVEAGRTRRVGIRNALRRLSDARGMLIGIVLTKYDARSSGYGYKYDSYYYSYGQGHTQG